jgi:TatD DNase family protein
MALPIHETHGHLDLLLNRLELIPNRDADFDVLAQISDLDGVFEKVQELLTNHVLFIQPTVSHSNLEFNYKMWNGFERIKVLIGSHPEIVDEEFSVKQYRNEQEQVLSNIMDDESWRSRIIGIGECGLDYYYSQDIEIKKKQWELLETQLQKAVELDLPVVFHCRDAFDDLFAMLDNFPQIQGKFDVHCFTGDVDIAKKVLGYDGYFGIGGIVTFKNGETLRQAVEYIPSNKILLETDLPFLAPVPHRGKTCLPEFITDVGKLVADLKGMSEEELWNQCYSNVTTLYSL